MRVVATAVSAAAALIIAANFHTMNNVSIMCIALYTTHALPHVFIGSRNHAAQPLGQHNAVGVEGAFKAL